VLRTSEGKVVLFEVGTGAQVEHWSVDAAILLRNGSHTTPVRPPQHVGVPQAPVVSVFEAKAGDEPPPGVKRGRKE
jgi:hypothetical protein